MQHIRDIAKHKLSKGYTHAVICWFAYADCQRGDVISCHRSYDAAVKKAAQDTGGFWAIRALDEVQ